jgi:putative nucleotidyltransferase with HDIG domain
VPINTLKLRPFIKDLLATDAEVFVVGGAVRDELMHRDIKDLDIVVRNFPLEKIISTLKKFGHCNLVGKSFGVIKFRAHDDNEREFDIALPRTEISTGEGHKDFAVNADPNLPLVADLARRDFTINAMARNLATDALIDPFGGQKDIAAKSLKIVFPEAFKEDPLRLLRAIQFAARFDFTIAPDTFARMQANAALIRTVSTERIIDEIRKLFLAPKPSIGFDLMRACGLLPIVFPDVHNMIGVTQPLKNNEDVYTHTMKVLNAARAASELEKPGDLTIMFSALFHDAGKPKTRNEAEGDPTRVTFYNHQHASKHLARKWLKTFKATTIGVEPERVVHLVEHHMFETKAFDNEKAVRRFINKVGKEHIFDLLDLRLADKKGGRFPNKVFGMLKLRDKIREEIERKAPFSPKDLALDGHGIMAMGFPPGPIIGTVQRFLMEKVLDEPTLNVKETLEALVRDNEAALRSPDFQLPKNLAVQEQEAEES